MGAAPAAASEAEGWVSGCGAERGESRGGEWLPSSQVATIADGHQTSPFLCPQSSFLLAVGIALPSKGKGQTSLPSASSHPGSN